MQYAGFWIRVGAYIIDAIVLAIGQYVLMALLGTTALMTNPEGAGDLQTSAIVMSYGVVAILGIFYFVVMESSAKQATLGKMALGLIVTDLDGRRISFLRALGRYFAKILSSLILLIGYIMVAFTARKQGLHDMVASTLVLRAKPGEVGVDATVFS